MHRDSARALELRGFRDGLRRHVASVDVEGRCVHSRRRLQCDSHDGDTTLHAALPDGIEQVHLHHALRRQLLRDGGEETRARLVVHGATARERSSSSRSTYSRRMCMKSCAFVTTPNAWCVPRSFSLLTTNSSESTQIVESSRNVPSASVTKAGSMLPVAIACSAVAIRMAIVALTAWARMASCASRASVMTSGNGPSSRMEPVRTKGMFFVTHAYMIPLVTVPFATAAAIEPAARTLLMARMCAPCPPCMFSPCPVMPSVVPKI